MNKNNSLPRKNQNHVVWTNSQNLPELSLPQYKSNASSIESKNISIDVILPYTQKEMAENCVDILHARAGINIRIIAVYDDAQLGFISIANQVFQQSNAQFVAYLAQDAFPGRYWMKIAIETIIHTNKALLAFNDGKWFGQLAAFGLVRRDWAEQNYAHKNLFFDEYQSHYADTELSVIAASQQMLAFNPNCLLIEVDFHKDKKPTNPQDKTLYAKRASNGFDHLVLDKDLLNKFS